MMFRPAVFMLLILGLAIAGGADARGPDVPCPTCEDNHAKAKPESGWWFNPHEPGTGLSFEVQGEILLGAYFGYTEAGAQAWYTFSGPLNWDAERGGYAFSGLLYAFADGSCRSCEYVAPVALPAEENISLFFAQRNHGTVAFGDTEQFIVPLVGGTLVSRDFPSVDYAFPKLGGAWVFVLTHSEVQGPFGARSVVLTAEETTRRLDDDGRTVWVRTHFFEYPHQTEVLLLATLECAAEYEASSDSRLPPECSLAIAMRFPDGQVRSERIPVAFANIGDSRIVATTNDGVRVQAHRIGYD